MYVEELDPLIAQQILGDEYNNLFRYRLYSSPDKFVIGVIDSTGKIIDEKVLEQDYVPLTDDELTKDDEVLHPPFEQKRSKSVLYSRIITGVMISIILLSIVAVIIFLKAGGVL